MRRKDRQIDRIEDILKIVDKCKVCRIAMIDHKRPYIVPLNFGYSYKNGGLQLYFHSATEGRKLEVMKKNPCVCFEMDCCHEVVLNKVACKNGYLYESVIGEGNIIFIKDNLEKSEALNYIMKNQVKSQFKFEEKHLQAVEVYKLVVESISGKVNKK